MRVVACVDGHQDLFRLLGRDPEFEPLAAIELGVFSLLVHEHALARAQLAVVTSPLAGLLR
jgi:hypothetical protein